MLVGLTGQALTSGGGFGAAFAAFLVAAVGAGGSSSRSAWFIALAVFADFFADVFPV